ncbi:hypothetical protein [Rhodosalinus halophilus]|uniref:hypothetical protein n=1 Tax=Rhodosalinus halophilus TaxID=2259333 RepID=UPI0011BFDC33|nr:hypothetical protein [Rhodosalinus halophilus]
MSGHIFIHIGPPKTATTSLQVAAEKLADTRYFYAGTFQPRERNSGSLAQQLHNACSSADKSQGHQVAERLRAECDAGKTVFLSEEMFLVHSRKVSWQRKLSELRIFLGDAPITIIVTLRKPTAALPSLYQELFRGLPLSQKLSFASFCRSKYANCFDYDFLQSEILSAGFYRARKIDFNKIAASEMSTTDLFGPATNMTAQTLDIGWENKGKTGKTSSERALPSVTLKDLANARGTRWLIERTMHRDSKLRKSLGKSAARLSLRPSRQGDLIVPKELGEALDRVYARHLSDECRTVNTASSVSAATP